LHPSFGDARSSGGWDVSEDHGKALAMIRMAFDANGIKFAIPTIAGDGEPSAAATGAVAHRALEFTKPAAAHLG
jgi:hypothetical protein